MSLERAKQYLEKKGFLENVIELEESTATVSQAAEALGVEPGRIAKTMSFLQGEQPVLILTLTGDYNAAPAGRRGRKLTENTKILFM